MARVMRSDFGLKPICLFEQNLLVEMNSTLQEFLKLEPNETLKATERLRVHLEPLLRKYSWSSNWPIDKSVSKDGFANFFIDRFLEEPESNEKTHRHRFFLQFMFDNRQSLGGNLLKFEVASRNAQAKGIQVTSIAITGSRKTLKQLGWDGAIATTSEYESAICGAYSNVVLNPPYIFSLEI